MRPHIFSFFLVVIGCHANANVQVAGGVDAPRCESPDKASVDLGPPPTASGNDTFVTLKCGTYKGDLVVKGHNVRVGGAGKGQTIIDGKLEIHGHNNRVDAITVKAPSEIRGHDNDVSGVEFAAGVHVKGHDNVN